VKFYGFKKPVFGFLSVLVVILCTAASIQLYNNGKSIYLKLKVFGDILEKIRTDYIEEKNPEDLIDNAIRGMVSDLDPHTTYFTKEQFDKWNQNFEGYSGIGIFFDIINNKITVISIIKRGPSEKIGLQTGDRIVAIDGESVVGIKRDDVPLVLMGPRGTKVTVTVERAGWQKPKSFSIVRDEVHVESVSAAFMIKPQVGYIAVARFSSTTEAELEQAMKKLEWLGAKKLILDLRQNGGGYLEAAVKVVDKFLPGGKKIVYTKGRIADSFREYYSTERSIHPMIPMILLIDRASASASEIVAGALQDWDRALIAGETSFGKGLVQNPYRFSDGTALLMTTACYYTPSGRMIQKPYGDRSIEEYFNGKKDDATKNSKGNPAFKTQILRRKIFGGGGITPDVVLSTKSDTLGRAIREIVYSPRRPLFTFMENYIKKHPLLRETDLSEFLRSYKLDSNALADFRRHLQNLDIAVTPEDFEKNREDIQFILKQTLAEMVWGEEAAYKTQAYRDRQLIEAMEHFPEAEALLSSAYPKRK
jgi:carboxyl-terminal processing protease